MCALPIKIQSSLALCNNQLQTLSGHIGPASQAPPIERNKMLCIFFEHLLNNNHENPPPFNWNNIAELERVEPNHDACNFLIIVESHYLNCLQEPGLDAGQKRLINRQLLSYIRVAITRLNSLANQNRHN